MEENKAETVTPIAGYVSCGNTEREQSIRQQQPFLLVLNSSDQMTRPFGGFKVLAQQQARPPSEPLADDELTHSTKPQSERQSTASHASESGSRFHQTWSQHGRDGHNMKEMG